MPTLQHVLRHNIVRILRCIGCDERQATNLMLQCIICLSVPTANKPLTLQEICDYSFQEWPEVNNPCPGCWKIRRLQGYENKLIN